jgi:hypothetical protein
VVTKVPGLDVLGLQWMHTFKSGLLSGVGSDAEYLAEHRASWRRVDDVVDGATPVVVPQASRAAASTARQQRGGGCSLPWRLLR